MLNSFENKKAIFTGCYDADGKLTITYSNSFTIDGKSVSSCGCGNTLEEAKSNAYQCAKMIANAQNSGATSYNTSHTPVFKEEMKGGGSKPSTDKQRFVITRMAEELGIDAEKEALASYGKSLNALQGSEAHQLIQSLKSKKG